MEAGGNCDDNALGNAWMESFLAVLQTELVFPQRYATLSAPIG